MTAPLTLADLRDAMRSAKACEEHVRYRDAQGAEGAAAVFAPDCDACAAAVALAVAERVREACAEFAVASAFTERCADDTAQGAMRAAPFEHLASAIREWRPT